MTESRRTNDAVSALDDIKTLKESGFRFCGICADDNGDGYDVMYFLADEKELRRLEYRVGRGDPIESVTYVYEHALAQEIGLEEAADIRIEHQSPARIGDEVMTGSAGDTEREMLTAAMDAGIEGAPVLLERMGGMSGYGASLAYCMAVEKAAGIKVPDRARYIRLVMQELSRIESHLMRLSRIADTIEAQSLSVRCLAARERVVALTESISGSRMMPSMCVPGGVRRDIAEATADEIMKLLPDIGKTAEALAEIFGKDRTMRMALEGVGNVDEETAAGRCFGIAARAAGTAMDAREDAESGLYKKLGFEPVTGAGGDALARVLVMAEETARSAELIEKALETMPKGRIKTDVKAMGAGKAAVRIEQPEGQTVFYVRIGGNEKIENIFVLMPDELNRPALASACEGAGEEDIALIMLSLGMSM